MRKLTEEERRLTVAASGGAVIGVVLTMVAVRLFGAPGRREDLHAGAQVVNGAPGAGQAQAPDASPGGHLTVTTPPRVPGVLRAAPGRSSTRLALVPGGTVVQVVEPGTDHRGGRWYRVKVPEGTTGWMSGEILS